MPRGNKSKIIGQKIGVLIHEGKPPKQAAAMAYSMARAGRLRAGGVYVHKTDHPAPKRLGER